MKTSYTQQAQNKKTSGRQKLNHHIKRIRNKLFSRGQMPKKETLLLLVNLKSILPLLKGLFPILIFHLIGGLLK